MFSLSIINEEFEVKGDFKFHNKRIRLVQKYKLKYWDPYYCDKNNVQIIILGRPVLDLFEWSDCVYNEVSFVSKKLLGYYLSTNSISDFCNKLNGGFIIVVIDYKKDRMIIVRDRLGIYPGYVCNIEKENDFLFSTHSDILAKYTGNNELDTTSIAEFIEQGSVSHPYTFYSNIKSMDNASYIELNYPKNITFNNSYFSFEKINKIKGKVEAFNGLRSAIKNSIERRSHKFLGKSGVLLSGGGDSRVIVSNSLTQLKAFTVYHNKNYELGITKEITKKTKIEHLLIRLSSSSNIKSLQESSKFTGGMVSGGSASWYSLIDKSNLFDVDNLLTGDYADWLLKDIAFNTEKVRLFGRQIPLNRFSKYKDSFYAPFVKISGLNSKTENRKNNKYKDIKNNLTKLQVRRIIPLSNEYTSSSRLILQRFFPWDTIFSDNEIIDIVFSLSPKFKLNSVLYNKVLGDLCHDLSKINHANKRVPLNSSIFYSTFIQSMNILYSKFFRNSNSSVDILDGRIEYIINNKEIMNMFYNIPSEVKNILIDICGIDIFNLSLDELANYDNHLPVHVISFSNWYHSVYTSQIDV